MATTKINVTAVINAGTTINNAKKTVGNVKSSYNSTRKNIDGAILNRNNLRNNFSNISTRIANLETYISNIKSTVENGANKYYNTDVRIIREFNSKNNGLKTSSGKTSTAMFGNAAAFITDVKKIDKKKSSDSQNSTSTSTTKKKDGKKEKKMDWWSWGDIWDFVGEFGNVGAVVSGIGGVITEEDKWKKALGGAKSIVGIAGKGFGELAEKATKSSSFSWKKAFGINIEKTKTFGESFKETIDDYNFGSAKGKWEKLKVGTKWAGSILTIGTVAYDNYFKDEENNSAGRKFAETIGESTVKIAGGAVVGAAASTLVAAGAALVGAAGAPVVVTGAVTVAATWAINKGFEYFTGKDAAEFISDTVLDAGISVGKGIGKAAKKATSAVAKWCKGLFK